MGYGLTGPTKERAWGSDADSDGGTRVSRAELALGRTTRVQWMASARWFVRNIYRRLAVKDRQAIDTVLVPVTPVNTVAQVDTVARV